MSQTPEQHASLRRQVQALQQSVYSQADPSADASLLEELAQAQTQLSAIEEAQRQQEVKEEDTDEDRPSTGRMLGAGTTGLTVVSQICMDPLPTGVYQLMDPESDPLLTVEIQNESRDIRRVCVKAYIEDLSATAVRTVEVPPRKKEKVSLMPTLFPERARAITEVQRATLHVVAEDLDGKLECHNTHAITCLSRSASFNSVRRPDTGEVVDLSHYYGAWVTPYVDCVQERVRSAVAKMPDGRMLGYQGDPDGVTQQVTALYQALHEAEIVYVNSVIDYGAASGHSTQRTRLPRESLATRSANCIDGTVLLASLLEGVSLNPSILLTPGHALVGWESWEDSGEWKFLETTMIGGGDFQAACDSGQRQYEQLEKFNKDRLKLHSVRDLREKKIWPME